MNREKQKGIFQKMAENIIFQVQHENYSNDTRAFILDEAETRQLRKVYLMTLFWSGLLGGLGVVILFCTKYAFPTWFPRTNIHIPIVDFSFQYNIIFTVYGFVLAYIELYLMYYANLKAIKKMVIICHYPHPSNPDFQEEVGRLAQVGLEKAGKHGKEIG